MTEYLTVAEVRAMHAELIERFGGSHGVRDMGALESAVFRPQTGYYQDALRQTPKMKRKKTLFRLQSESLV